MDSEQPQQNQVQTWKDPIKTLPDWIKDNLPHAVPQLCHISDTLLVHAERSDDTHATTGYRTRRWSVDCKTVSWPIDLFGDKEPIDEETQTQCQRWVQLSQFQATFRKGTTTGLPNPERYYALQRGPIYSPPRKVEPHVELDRSLIEKDQFLDLTKHSHAGWFHDNSIGVGFEILSKLAECDKYRIALIQPMVARNIARIGMYGGDDTWIALGDGLEDTYQNFKAYAYEVNLLKNKDFIFIPISDGYNPSDEDNQPGATAKCSHWTLLVLDCRAKRMQARYYDSLSIKNSKMLEIAANCMEGAFHLIKHGGATNVLETVLVVDNATPDQYTHNACDQDTGACGPFVWAMTKELVLYIADLHADERGLPKDFTLELPVNFPHLFDFDSGKTRKTLQALIAREKRLQMV